GNTSSEAGARPRRTRSHSSLSAIARARSLVVSSGPKLTSRNPCERMIFVGRHRQRPHTKMRYRILSVPISQPHQSKAFDATTNYISVIRRVVTRRLVKTSCHPLIDCGQIKHAGSGIGRWEAAPNEFGKFCAKFIER